MSDSELTLREKSRFSQYFEFFSGKPSTTRPTERSDEGSQKYHKIRDLSHSVSSLSLIENIF